jgi:hypothetical protein
MLMLAGGGERGHIVIFFIKFYYILHSISDLAYVYDMTRVVHYP